MGKLPGVYCRAQPYRLRFLIAETGKEVLFIDRAQRFEVPMRLLWRIKGEVEWSEAISVNASRSGVLFQTSGQAPVGTEVEMIFALAWETAPWVDVADVRCAGRVARQCLVGQSTAIAATIDRYMFLSAS
jgi:hypothetical protein